MTTDSDTEYVIVGKITGPYGIRGWVRVYSFTDPVSNILNYKPWYIKRAEQSNSDWKKVDLIEGKPHGKGIVVNLETVSDRNQAELMHGYDIAVLKSQIPEAEEGEYYWRDLIGLRVLTLDDVDLGKVDSLMETGANDVLVVKGDRERLIPFVMDEHIKQIDLDAGVVRVDWDPDF